MHFSYVCKREGGARHAPQADKFRDRAARRLGRGGGADAGPDLLCPRAYSARPFGPRHRAAARRQDCSFPQPEASGDVLPARRVCRRHRAGCPGPSPAGRCRPCRHVLFRRLGRGRCPPPPMQGSFWKRTTRRAAGKRYIPCGTGTIKNNTRVPAAELAAEIEGPAALLGGVEQPGAADPHYAHPRHRGLPPVGGALVPPGDGSRTTDRSYNMCAVGAG